MYKEMFDIVYTDPCHQSIYPPGFKPSCRMLIKQWTYNPSTGRCIEFEYYPCGEDKDGYNVYSTEQECTKTCINKGIALLMRTLSVK